MECYSHVWTWLISWPLFLLWVLGVGCWRGWLACLGMAHPFFAVGCRETRYCSCCGRDRYSSRLRGGGEKRRRLDTYLAKVRITSRQRIFSGLPTKTSLARFIILRIHTNCLVCIVIGFRLLKEPTGPLNGPCTTSLPPTIDFRLRADS
ncbi:hypothetical protein B0T26DRAFT_345687 [Lasiosphaeria miniovina]|uniref:Uncharacterized protein n=1 Tax=Lasiosphaeria miniovina TaxID=1954250 RepID=A0AA40ABH8_9PEZI|nr:uncharacterized protein B0T26DRAFT_345687 [Lasiosphaeria miniovina]KAK0712823.1 hypothetical protein B0T26DRAFT_345687 [Lasiosphaeria miniovina]